MIDFLFFWFLLPLVAGMVGGVAVGATIGLIASYIWKTKYLSKSTSNIELSKIVSANLQTGNCNTYSLKKFAAMEKGKTYIGHYDTYRGEYKDVAEVDFVDCDITFVNKIKKEQIVVW